MSVVVEVIRPSRSCTLLILGVHAAAAFSFVLLQDDVRSVWCAPVWGVLLLSLAWLCRRRGACVRRLALQEDGGLCLDPGQSGERSVGLLPSSVVLERVLWLIWRERGRGGAMMLCADQFLPEDWRQLQRWARLRGPARFGVEPGPGGEGLSSARDVA